MVILGIPLGIYIGLRGSNLHLDYLAFTGTLVYLALFLVFQQLAYNDLDLIQIVVLCIVNGLGFTFIGLLTSLGSFVFCGYLCFLLIALAWIIVNNLLHKKQLRRIDDQLPRWELQQKMVIQDRLRSGSEFHTYCFECRHFNPKTRRCGLRLHVGPVRKVKFNFMEREEYCLYWNVIHHENIVVDKTDKRSLRTPHN